MKKITLVSFLYFTFIACVAAQNPCISGLTFLNVLNGKNVKLSTIKGNGTPNLSIDGIISNDESLSSKTYIEDSPYWEADLGDNLTLESIKIFYPSSAYSEVGLKNYYVLMSEEPFSDNNLEHQIEAPNVSYVYVESYKPSGYAIALNYKQAQYIRVQLAERGVLTLSEIQIPGTAIHDICGNGIDDDCDGKKDCDDTDCGIVVQNIDPKMPSCPDCNDGKIGLQNSGKNIKYSIDGGKTFITCGNNCTINNVPEGDHEIIVKNAITGCETRKTVSIRAKVGPDNQCCPNGGFENGKFDKWVGGNGEIGTTITNGPITGNTSPPLFSKFNIIESNGNSFDSNVGDGISLNSPTGGNYIAKLGDDKPGFNKATMTYCMKVSECNKDFVFNFALVLEDPGHKPKSDQPKFEWKIKDNDGLLLKTFPPIVADNDNPYFKIKKLADKPDLVYRPWTCEKLDLSTFLGKDICIEFSVSDCNEGEHKGYAYIDGLCKKEESKPKVLVNGNSIYCKNQKATISGKESKNFNKYSWEVCRYVNGVPNNCFTTKDYYDKEPILDDAIAFFFGAPHNPANPLACGDKFKVTLNMDSGCESKKTSTDFTYNCDEAPVIHYPDIIVCNSNDVVISGTTTNCPNCTYSWTPPQYLNNSNIHNPVIQGSMNSLALHQTYTVTATASNGCVTKDKVNIFQSRELIGNAKFSFENTCEGYYAFLDVEFAFPINGSEIEANIIASSVSLFEKRILVTPGNSTIHRFKFPTKLQFCRDIEFKAYVKYKAPTNDFNQIGNCALYATAKKAKEENSCTARAYMPNTFNSTGTNTTYSPKFSKNVITNAHVQIWARNGSLIFDGKVSAPSGSFLTGNESAITWDGTFKGSQAQQGTYTWLIGFDTCAEKGEFNTNNCDTKNTALTGKYTACGDVTKL